MKLKIQKIGNSLGVILPVKEIRMRKMELGDYIELEIVDDPFWLELKKYTKEQRQRVDKIERDLGEDDLSEWKDL